MAVLAPVVRSFDAGERRRLGGLFAIVALLHVAGWGALLLYVAPRYPVLLGLGGIAYVFGLRHAFDADHISAIDNTTRKLLQEGKKPMGVGFFFSLGHSTVVLLIALALGLAVNAVVSGVLGAHGAGGQLKAAGALIGTGVSGLFLLFIGLFNLIVWREIYGVYRRMRRGAFSRADLEQELTAGGIMTRAFGRMFRLIDRSWKMYPVGFLFGLGFDTATEVSLLAISAGAAAQHLPLVAILVLPILFAAAMALMDTADGAFMAKAYAWAFANPIRKVYYNLTVTGLSVFVALFVGGVELLQIIGGQLNWSGAVWKAIQGLNFNVMGAIIVAAFVVTWAAALLIWRTRGIEERWTDFVSPSA